MLQNILKSKTVWLGFLVAIIPMLQFLQTLPLTSTQASVISTILGLLVMVNRFFTTQGIGDKSTSELG